MKSVVSMTNSFFGRCIGVASAKRAGVLTAGLLSAIAGCSVSAPRHEAPIVERLGHCPEYYGALLRLPDEPIFWHGTARCYQDR
jgi:hypothetical protein